MTLEEYKNICLEIHEEGQKLKGTQEETVNFFEDLAKKYPEVVKFNKKALECKNVTEFKKLADSFGMKFVDEESAEELYLVLADSKKDIDLVKQRLNTNSDISDISGGGFLDTFLDSLSSTSMAIQTSISGDQARSAFINGIFNAVQSGRSHATLLAGAVTCLGYVGNKVYNYFKKPKDPNIVEKIL